MRFSGDHSYIVDDHESNEYKSEIAIYSIKNVKYRGKGIGTQLMKEMLLHLKEHGYTRASLAVQKENYAVRMYEKVGFNVIDENAEEYIMVCELQGLRE